MPKVRGNNGKFIKCESQEMDEHVHYSNENESVNKIEFVMPNIEVRKPVKIIFIFIIFSPWIYVVYKGNYIQNFTVQIGKFYCINFSGGEDCFNYNKLNSSKNANATSKINDQRDL